MCVVARCWARLRSGAVTARRASALLAVLLFAVTACSSGPRTTWVWPGADRQGQVGPGGTAGSPSPGASAPRSAPPSASGAAGAPLTSPVIINQSRTGPAERRLAVDPNGSWACDNCSGDGKSTAGQLTAAQMKQLQAYLDDPAFKDEDGVPPTLPQCSGKLDSNMTTSSGIVLWSNCRGAGPPPVSVKILKLLADATPLDAGLPA
jgi:hypothetical protein